MLSNDLTNDESVHLSNYPLCKKKYQAYHGRKGGISFLPLPILSMHPPSTNGLRKNQNVYRQTDAMMRICQASVRAHCKPAKDEYNRCEQDSQYLEPDVYPDGSPCISCMES